LVRGHNSDNKPFDENEIAKKIRESGQLGNVTLLMGYIGKSDSPEVVRLYLDISFDSYLDIPKNGIVHSVATPESVLPFGGSYIWITKDTQISEVKVEATKEQAKFLQGRISKRYVSPEAAEPTTDRAGFVKRIRRAGRSYSDLCSVGCSVACDTVTWDWCCASQYPHC
jgi:hypothetical protein